MLKFIIAALLITTPTIGQTLTIAGQPEIVLSHTQMTCGRQVNGSGRDVTDVPASAFRRKDGSVVLVAGNQNNHFAEGPSLDDVKRTSCASLLKPINDPDPAKFTARRWLFSIYAKDYDHVFGFVHNEYHGDNFHSDGCEKTSQRNFECWYASSLLVRSTDGGFTFGPDTAVVLAAPPVKFATGQKRIGDGTPKAVGNPNDGMVYVMVNDLDINGGKGAKQCLLRGSGVRTDDWLAWDGRGFNLNMGSPYVVERKGDCAPVLPFVVQSLRYVPALKKFVALGQKRRQVLYTFSDDLITWSEPQTLMQVVRHGDEEAARTPPTEYFSLLDPTSHSINFDTLEGRPYLYFVRFIGRGIQRDLMRVSLSLH